MTQTPRGFDPQEPADASNTQYPVTADGPASPSDAGYPAGVPASRSAEAAGAPADAVATSRGEVPRTGTAGTPAPSPPPHQVTRAGMVWVAVACALVVLVLLIVFILQNQVYVQVAFFGFAGSVPLGIALFIAAVGGGVLVAIAGAARIIQLRRAAHRQRVGQGTRAR